MHCIMYCCFKRHIFVGNKGKYDTGIIIIVVLQTIDS